MNSSKINNIKILKSYLLLKYIRDNHISEDGAARLG
jgi:hypothetical protein